ncbi:MAG: C10 family peptidase [Bacteroidales bacterium]|nr:C10 family peptidase [Bacteroidales bacterium]
MRIVFLGRNNNQLLMKINFPLWCILILTLYSCSKDYSKNSDSLLGFSINLNDYVVQNEIDLGANIVSISDVKVFSDQFLHSTKAGGEIQSIEPIKDHEGDTLFYLVNYDCGWMLIASDRRVQPIIAENADCSFEEATNADAVRLWLDIIASEMKLVKQTSDEKLGIPKEEQVRNRLLWESLCNSEELLDSILSSTKSGGDPDHPPIPGLDGEYVYDTTYVTEVPYDYVDHLIPVMWAPWAPFNRYCPQKVNPSNERAAAGHATIAGAQMLYYLHYYFGVPEEAPSTGFCGGDTSSNPYSLQSFFDNPSSDVWDSMEDNDYEYASVLIGDVGKKIFAHYNDTTTVDDYSLLKNKVFLPYGITCDNYGSYDETLVQNSLINGMPVIVRAYGWRSNWFFGYNYGKEHTFIIDGYKRFRTETRVVYRWEYYESGQGSMLPEHDPTHIINLSYSSPHFTYFKMNWGMYPSLNSSWFTMTGNWHIEPTQYYQMDLDYQRKMVINFDVL